MALPCRAGFGVSALIIAPVGGTPLSCGKGHAGEERKRESCAQHLHAAPRALSLRLCAGTSREWPPRRRRAPRCCSWTPPAAGCSSWRRRGRNSLKGTPVSTRGQAPLGGGPGGRRGACSTAELWEVSCQMAQRPSPMTLSTSRSGGRGEQVAWAGLRVLVGNRVAPCCPAWPQDEVLARFPPQGCRPRRTHGHAWTGKSVVVGAQAGWAPCALVCSVWQRCGRVPSCQHVCRGVRRAGGALGWVPLALRTGASFPSR